MATDAHREAHRDAHARPFEAADFGRERPAERFVPDDGFGRADASDDAWAGVDGDDDASRDDADAHSDPTRSTRAPDDDTDADAFAARLAAVERRLDDLDAAVQALGGAVGDVEHVNETVERRANAALAAVERPPARHPVPDIPDDDPASDAATADGLLVRLFGR